MSITESHFKPLKLRAHDPEDMRVIASMLQDALVPLSDVTFLKAEKRFAMVVNRFRWENDSGPAQDTGEPARPSAEPEDVSFAEDSPYERVNCGLVFDKVQNVRVRNLDLAHKDQILNLLTVAATENAIALHFSDGGVIRLEVSAVRCHLEDVGEPWPTAARPTHPLDESGEETDGTAGSEEPEEKDRDNVGHEAR